MISINISESPPVTPESMIRSIDSPLEIDWLSNDVTKNGDVIFFSVNDIVSGNTMPITRKYTAIIAIEAKISRFM
ncbi:MAG: hypothetical protein CBE29_00825 [Rickettsiales bacterium TMED269]|nr:MAG: hypothetical protein CBE29_00825 [Rickettsiales bacterium TMED269]